MASRAFAAAVAAAALLPGCALLGRPAPPGAEGARVLQALRDASEAAVARLRASLVFAEIQLQNGQELQATGIVLAEDGTALVPFPLERDQIQRIRAWVSGKEWPAAFQAADDRLGMSLVRIAAGAGPFRPIPADIPPTPARGEWLVSLTASGKDTDFQIFVGLGLVRGTVLQEFDRILLDGGGGPAGTVLSDARGTVVGLLAGGLRERGPQALSFGDVRRRLAPRLARKGSGGDGAAGGGSSGKDKPSIGVVLDPINEDDAEVSGLPAGAVWIREVFRGSPAERAGLRAGDLVVKVNGDPVGLSGRRALARFFKLLSPELGREVTLEILRAGKAVPIPVRFEKSPEPRELKADDLGIEVKEITESVYHTEPRLFQREGVFVSEVVPGSAAGTSSHFGEALVRPGDVVVELDGSPTPDLEAFTAALEALRRRAAPLALLKIRRGVPFTHAALNLRLKTERRGDGR